jgi:N-methylhydantoinase A/oxoprolinase/acetone carboxylase beta subunit
MRYGEQVFEIDVPLDDFLPARGTREIPQMRGTRDVPDTQGTRDIPDTRGTRDVPHTREAIEEAFHAAHERLYTYALRDQDVVLVNAGVSVIGRLPAAPVAVRDDGAAPASPKAQRQIYLSGWIDVPVFDFAALAPGQEVTGPAIVESDTTTVLLRNDETARFDARGWLDIALRCV